MTWDELEQWRKWADVHRDEDRVTLTVAQLRSLLDAKHLMLRLNIPRGPKGEARHLDIWRDADKFTDHDDLNALSRSVELLRLHLDWKREDEEYAATIERHINEPEILLALPSA